MLAFINFTTAEAVLSFWQIWNGRGWKNVAPRSQKRCQIVYSRKQHVSVNISPLNSERAIVLEWASGAALGKTLMEPDRLKGAGFLLRHLPSQAGICPSQEALPRQIQRAQPTVPSVPFALVARW